MSEYNNEIVKQFTKFIFPFRYDASKTDLASKCYVNDKGAEVKLFTRFSQEARELRQGLSELLSMDGGNSKIADCFEISYNARSHFGLPRRQDETMRFYARAKDKVYYDVAIQRVALYLFESEVGFVELEAAYKSTDIADCVNCNYFICELKSGNNIFVATRDVWNNETKTKEKVEYSFTAKELIDKVLENVGGVKDIQRDKYPDYTEDKGIIYSYLLLNGKPNDIDDLLFHLRKNYKDSYLSHNRTVGSFNPFVHQPFENSYWTASFNGAVNVSYLTGQETTDNFFLNAFPPKLHDTYFTLFIHVLHQRYALLKFVGDMGELDKLTMDYDSMKRQLAVANNYQAQSANLKFRAFFKMPSMVEHINDYYNLLSRTYQINQMYEHFNKDLTSLQEICGVYVTRIKQRDEKIIARRKAKVGIFVSVFGTLVAVAALINSYWGILEKIFGHEVQFFSAPVLAAIVAILLPVVTIIVDVVNQIKEIRKMTNDLNSEVKDRLVEDDATRRRKARERRREK